MPELSRQELAQKYEEFQFSEDGIGGLTQDGMPDAVFEQLSELGKAPLTKVQLNQLLVLSNTGSMSDGFFRYYWLHNPEHPYDVTKLPYFDGSMTGGESAIQSHDHLRWGLYRLYVDGLLFFGNVAGAYRSLRSKAFDELVSFFKQKDSTQMRFRNEVRLSRWRLSPRTIGI